MADDEIAELENEWLKITLDRFDGSFSILDKRNGAVYENQGVLASVGDRGDEYNFTPTPDDSLYLIEVKDVAYVPRAFDHAIGVVLIWSCRKVWIMKRWIVQKKQSLAGHDAD